MPGVPAQRRDPFGLPPQPQPGQPMAHHQQPQAQYRPPPPPQQQFRPPPPQQQQQQPMHNPIQLGGDGGEAVLRNALSQASREVIERIAWEVVPQLAEAIIRENLDRLMKDREPKN